MVLITPPTATEQIKAIAIQSIINIDALRGCVAATASDLKSDKYSDNVHNIAQLALRRIDMLAATEISNIIDRRNGDVAGLRLARWSPNSPYRGDAGDEDDSDSDGHGNNEKRDGCAAGVAIVGVVREWWTRHQARRDIAAVERCKVRAIRGVEVALKRFMWHRSRSLQAKRLLVRNFA